MSLSLCHTHLMLYYFLLIHNSLKLEMTCRCQTSERSFLHLKKDETAVSNSMKIKIFDICHLEHTFASIRNSIEILTPLNVFMRNESIAMNDQLLGLNFVFFRIVFTFILTFSIFRQTQSRLKFWNCLDLFHALVDYSGPKSWITSNFFPRCRVVQITGETITLELSLHFHKM